MPTIIWCCPWRVLEELDGLKKAEGERGANARTAIRYLERIRHQGDLLKGVELPGGGTLRVEANCIDVKLPESMPEEKMDNRILKVCLGLAERSQEPVVLVTKDILLRVKAQMAGVAAEDFINEQVSAREDQYTGRIACFIPDEAMKDSGKKAWDCSLLYVTDEKGNISMPELVENEFVVLKSDQSLRKTQLGRVKGKRSCRWNSERQSPTAWRPGTRDSISCRRP